MAACESQGLMDVWNKGGTRHEYPDRTVLANCTGITLRGRETGLFLVSVMNLAKGQKIYHHF